MKNDADHETVMAHTWFKQAQTSETEGTPPSFEHASFRILPKAYQGGALPEASQGVSHPMGRVEKKKLPPPPPKPQVQVVPRKVPPPVHPRKKRQKKILWLVVGLCGIALLVALSILWISSRARPAPETPPATPATPDVRVAPPSAVEPPKEPVSPPAVPDELTNVFGDGLVSGKDTDSDGLSDKEEVMYGANPQLPDSDRDGFLDGNEVFHRYDPSRLAPTTLVDSGFVRWYDIDPTAFPFTYVSPVAWAFEPHVRFSDTGRHAVVAPTGERFNLSFTPLSPDKTLEAYVRTLVDDGDKRFIKVDFSKTKDGQDLAVTNDHLEALVLLGEWVVRVEYALMGERRVEYLQTFQMLVNSLKSYAHD